MSKRRIRATHFTAPLPDGLLDQTNYEFRADGSVERLTCDDEFADGLSAQQIIEAECRRILDVEGVSGEFAPPTHANLGPQAGLSTQGNLQLGRDALRAGIALAVANNRARKITYLTPADQQKFADAFARITSSISATDNETPTPKQPGFIRRYAGNVSLLVPENLRPPDSYALASADGHLRITFHSATAKDQAWRSIDDELNRDKSSGLAVTDESQDQPTVLSNPARALRYTLVDELPWKTDKAAIYRLETTLPTGARLKIFGRAPDDRKSELHQHLDQILNGIQPAGAP